MSLSLSNCNLSDVQLQQFTRVSLECITPRPPLAAPPPLMSPMAQHDELALVLNRCASLDGDADRLVYFTQQDGAFQLFDGDRIAVLAALLVRSIIADLPLPPQAIKVSQAAHLPGTILWFQLMLLFCIN